jgi:hypothetical protein
MTRIRRAGLLAVVAAALVVAPVAADTFDAPNGDRIVAGASFEFTSGGLAYTAGSDVVWNKLAGTIRISASYFTSTPVTCPGADPIDPSDDYDASIETSFFADAPVASSAFGSKLSSARAAGSVSGDITRYDPCTGNADVVGQDTIAVSIALVATGPSVKSNSHSTGVDEEGNRFVQVVRYEDRTASGSVTFDGVVHQVDGGIGSQWWRTPLPR